VLADVETDLIDDRLRAMIRFVEKVTVDPDSVTPNDARRVRDAGVSRQAMEDALMVTFCFNLITRLADAFGWYIPNEDAFEASATNLLNRGYLMPMRGKKWLAAHTAEP
jgi:hypothetical protein